MQLSSDAFDRLPTDSDVGAIVRRCLAAEVRSVTRFPTGSAHFVYDVMTADGRRVVARLGRIGQEADFASAVYWSGLLRPRGVPLPALLGYDVRPGDGAFPFMLVERLQGCDLREAYPALSAAEKQALARRLAKIQASVGGLPPGPGFGFASSYDDRSLHATWKAVLLASLERSRARIEAVGAVSPAHVDRVAECLPALDAHLATVAPSAFLDDTTTKNVLIHEGRLSGIVDVDWICFGDPLFTVALTQMSLLNLRYDTDYIGYWVDALDLKPEQHVALTLYTAIFGVDFLGELGQQFNRDAAPVVDAAEIDHLVAILDRLLARL